MGKRRSQVNLLLTDDQFRVLEALRYLEGKSSKAEVLLPHVTAYLDKRAQEPEVQAVLQSRAAGETEE